MTLLGGIVVTNTNEHGYVTIRRCGWVGNLSETGGGMGALVASTVVASMCCS